MSRMELAGIVSKSEVDIGINSDLCEAVGSRVITTIEVDSPSMMLDEGVGDIVVMGDSLLMVVSTDCSVTLSSMVDTIGADGVNMKDIGVVSEADVMPVAVRL